jgi:hypothetical protein
MSRQSVKLTEVAGAVVLCGGVALLSLSRSTKPIGLSFGSFSHWPAAAIIAGIAFIAVEIGRRRGPWRASLVGLGAGLVFGIQDALTRQTLEILQGHSVTVLFTSWPPYCLIGAGVVGIWLMQNAFSAGPLHASLPTIAAGEPVAGIALGIVVFGDRIQISPGQLAIEAGGIAALIIGTVAVARSSAFSSLRKITDVILPGSDSAESAGDSPDRPAPSSAEPAHTTPEPKPAPAHTAPAPAAPELAPAHTAHTTPAPTHTTPAPAHTTPQPKPAPNPAQRLARALISRPQAPGQASGGDGG